MALLIKGRHKLSSEEHGKIMDKLGTTCFNEQDALERSKKKTIKE